MQKAGAEVVGPFATHGRALDLVSAGEPVDAAILDINLRGEAIFPLADALGARNIPFVFATGYDQASIPEPYRAIPRWEKPFDLGLLIGALPALTRARAKRPRRRA